MEYTITEMDEIHQKWFFSGYKAGVKDGYEEGYRAAILANMPNEDELEEAILWAARESRGLNG